MTYNPPMMQVGAQENRLYHELVYKLPLRVARPINVSGNGFAGVLPDSQISG